MADKIRTLRVVENAGQTALVITEAANGRVKRDAYFLASKLGAVEFSKDDGTRYHVSEHTCSCPGNRYHGSKTTCKHRAAVQRLVALGRLKIVEVAK